MSRAVTIGTNIQSRSKMMPEDDFATDLLPRTDRFSRTIHICIYVSHAQYLILEPRVAACRDIATVQSGPRHGQGGAIAKILRHTHEEVCGDSQKITGDGEKNKAGRARRREKTAAETWKASSSERLPSVPRFLPPPPPPPPSCPVRCASAPGRAELLLF